jgi:damage-control phosphatase, subfamily I
MKAKPHCKGCLEDLARRVLTLSGGDEDTMAHSLDLIRALFSLDRSPTVVSNQLLKEIRLRSGVGDPFAELKRVEFERAVSAAKRLKGCFPGTLEGALRLSAFGNGGDFFAEHDFDLEGSQFDCDVDKIARQVYVSKEILILGDNPGDFVFDLALVNALKKMGKQVFYAIKEKPVQNDMSMVDFKCFGPAKMPGEIVSTGTDEVGIRKDDMSGVIRRCWEDGSCIIAKGMGNYETISEYDRERPVIYIMNVKCMTVAESVGRKIGTYIAISGGGHG